MLDLLLGNNGLAALLAFALVLIPAVIIHELGHFFAGKSVGITILEFGIGFPPRIGRMFVWRGTEFTLNLLPLGGFVRPLGEDMVSQQGEEAENLDRREADERGIPDPKSVSEASPIKRILFLSAGAIANLVSAFILFVMIGMLGVRAVGVDVVTVEPESVLYDAGLRSGDVIRSINGEVFLPGEYMRLTEMLNVIAANLQGETSESVELTVLRESDAGESETFTATYTPASTGAPEERVRVVSVLNGTPAQAAGIRAGDVIAEFNGMAVTSIEQLQEITSENAGTNVQLALQRSGEIVETELVPREDPPPQEGSMGIGIDSAFHLSELGMTYQPMLNRVIVNLSFFEALNYSGDRFASLFATIASIPSAIIEGQISAQEARPVSIVGISQAGGEFLQASIEQSQPVIILEYIALISIALGLTNLLPIPALDGGRILFVLIEMVRGRPIPPEREGVVHLLGLVFLLSITVVVIINDILNPITDMLP